MSISWGEAGDLPMLSAADLEEQLHVFAKDAVAAYKRERARARELGEALADLQTAYLETIRSMAFVVEAKDAYTGQHLERCRVYGVALLQELGIEDDYPDAQYGFLLHDAGKVGVPERILGKPGPLTAAEWRVMRTHPLIGYQMLASIPFMQNAAEIVRSHHEMFDGSGYPEGLKGDEIPLPARVFSVVDAFDAMTTDRPYRAALSIEQAAEELARMAGTQFDPDVVAAFLPLCKRLRPAPV
ncbi:MAG TPA: HD domain-containing phosphohydrolase [Acidimicrobiales bacterium]|nr:HD domain-containing phosphohydrolase [Acidimicrobiales bacterium]